MQWQRMSEQKPTKHHELCVVFDCFDYEVYLMMWDSWKKDFFDPTDRHDDFWITHWCPVPNRPDKAEVDRIVDALVLERGED